MVADPDLSIVVLSWNTREMLLEALHSAWPVRDLRAELVVVDNASSDGSADAVEREFPAATLIRNPTNLGFAGGVNVGFAAARGRLVVLLNSDTLVLGDAMQRLVAYADEHPEAAILGPRVLNRDRTLQASCFRFPSILNLALQASYLYQLFPRSAFFNRARMGGELLDAPREVEVVSGCCFMVRRSLLETLGGLDEAYFMYAEETDFCFRARKAGYQVHYVPLGEIVHYGGGSARLASRKMFLEFRRSLLRFFWKNRSPASASVAQWMLLAFLTVRVPYWALRAAVPSSERAAHVAQLQNYLAGIAFLARPLSRILSSVPARS